MAEQRKIKVTLFGPGRLRRSLRLRQRFQRLPSLSLPLLFALACLLSGCNPPATTFRNTDIGGAPYGRDFILADPAGKPRRLADYRGKVVAIFFGYTQCPEICPTTLAGMAAALKLLGDADAARVQVLFITLDPERDTPELLATYVPAFHPSFIGLTGDPAAIAATAGEFRIFYRKQPGSTPGTYSIDHSAVSYLYDPQGRLRLSIKHGEAAENIAADIRLLLVEK